MSLDAVLGKVLAVLIILEHIVIFGVSLKLLLRERVLKDMEFLRGFRILGMFGGFYWAVVYFHLLLFGPAGIGADPSYSYGLWLIRPGILLSGGIYLAGLLHTWKHRS